MKVNLSFVFMALGILFILCIVFHWLFIFASIFAFIGAVLFKKK